VSIPNRATFLPVPQVFILNQVCLPISRAFGGVYLVGSCLERRDYRDVDVRCIVSDSEYLRMFPGCFPACEALHSTWSVLCAAVSVYLQKLTGLPVDFQIQQQTDANTKYGNARRHPIGMFPNFETHVSDPPVSEGEG